MEKKTAWLIYEKLCESRFVQEKLKEHEIGGYFDVGEEAITIGALAALGQNDVVSTYFRGEAAMLRWKGVVDLDDQMAWWTGRQGKANPVTNVLPSLWTDPARGVLGPASSCLGGDMDLFCGAALAQKLQKTGGVVLAFIGDGAVAKGNFHEVMTFASLQKLPLILMVRANGWAMSTPTARGIAFTDFTKVGEAYHVAAAEIDGNDGVRVYEEVARAAQHARSGQGPYLIEAKTYRMGPHSGNDEDDYRDPAVLDAWKKRDPILKMEEHLRAFGCSDAELSAVQDAVRRDVARAYEHAMTLPQFSMDEIRENHVHTVNRMWGRE